MKMVLKLIVGALIGFAGGYLLIEALYGNINNIYMDNIYYYLSIVIVITALGLMIYTLIKNYQLTSRLKGNNTDFTDDEWDRYKYNSYNILTVSSSSAIILSFIGLSIQLMHARDTWLLIATGILFLVSVGVSFVTPNLIQSLFPDRDLPEPGDKDYADKLFNASDDGEIYIMAKAMYRSTNLTTLLLFFALVAMMFYTIITGESQIFSIILIGIILVINQVKYSIEIRDK